jgi:hypothetical protein
MKNSYDTIGNRSRDLPVCSAMPQPLRHRAMPQSLRLHYRNYQPKVEVHARSNASWDIRPGAGTIPGRLEQLPKLYTCL